MQLINCFLKFILIFYCLFWWFLTSNLPICIVASAYFLFLKKAKTHLQVSRMIFNLVDWCNVVIYFIYLFYLFIWYIIYGVTWVMLDPWTSLVVLGLRAWPAKLIYYKNITFSYLKATKNHRDFFLHNFNIFIKFILNKQFMWRKKYKVVIFEFSLAKI